MAVKKRNDSPNDGMGGNRGQEDPPTGQFRNEKRAPFAQSSAGSPRGRNNNPLVLGVIAVAVVLVVAFVFMNNKGKATAGGGDAGASVRHQAGSFTPVVPQNGEIRLAKAQFDDKKARYYTYKDSGKEIDFFVLESADGVIRAAIDACDVCYPFKKGYRQEGDEMVCNNCGQRFASVKINVITGGCNPAALTRSSDGDSVIIKVSDLLKDNATQNGKPLF